MDRFWDENWDGDEDHTDWLFENAAPLTILLRDEITRFLDGADIPASGAREILLLAVVPLLMEIGGILAVKRLNERGEI